MTFELCTECVHAEPIFAMPIPIKTRNLKKNPKRNLPNVGMGGWMEVLADKVHKQGEHIAIYISHNHPYICIAVTH